MKTQEIDADEGRVIDECAYLAAQVRMPSGERLIDRLIIHANTVRTAKKARWTRPMVAVLEEDLIAVLSQFYRRAEWYREPTRGPFPGT